MVDELINNVFCHVDEFKVKSIYHAYCQKFNSAIEAH